MVLRNCDLESSGAGVGCISGNDNGRGLAGGCGFRFGGCTSEVTEKLELACLDAEACEKLSELN
jgi:hypothetical protein